MPTNTEQPTHKQHTKISLENRDLDPNVRQKHAANPQTNIWVSASAGTGKTKVLTDRVLRLLLPRSNGERGTEPHKILCLTFTKAGANEMSLRINNTLGEWAVLPESALTEKLTKLLDKPATTEEIHAARKLFAQVIDTPGGIQIMTIHSFCQSILARFPLEAGLTPNFRVLEENQATPLLLRAIEHVLKHGSEPTKEAINTISREINEDQFFQLVKDIIKERTEFQSLLKHRFGTDGLYTTLCQYLDITPNADTNDIEHQTVQNSAFDIAGFRALCPLLAASDKKTDQNNLTRIQDFLAATTTGERLKYFNDYKAFFFTQTGEVRKRIITQTILKQSPDTEKMIAREVERIQQITETIKRLKMANYTDKLLQIGEEILCEYNKLKKEHSALDFDDLITHTYQLLEEKTTAQWVLFKLDQGLDHILVDEAQDTNPEQWKIIDALSEEFFTNTQESDNKTRTLFVVGDEKQSIYSFQRASPEEFERARDKSRNKVTAAQAKWDDIALNISFRTTKSVLQAVDKVFASDEMRTGLGLHPIEHHSFRRGQEGIVELWPLFKPEDTKEAYDPWTPPTQIIDSTSPAIKLANYIANQIKNWLDTGEHLPSRNRPIKPGDIMILMRTRSALVAHITRALKNHNIPVSGADRMILTEQISVQDLLAFAAFGLLPEDDLTLACILKSPLIGLSEEELYTLAYNRTGTLWDALRTNKEHQQTYQYLKTCTHLSKALRPLEFFNSLLQTPCPADSISALRAIRGRLGNDALDPIDELLNLALDFERDNIPTLQYFLHWIENQQTSIKREMDSSTNEIRIITTHGSKGLQAPIVILPDTTRLTRHIPGQSDKRLLWPAQTGLDIPLWSPSKDLDPTPFSKELDKIDTRLDEEYKRLLYVAMTRAEDRLYITGFQNSTRKPIEESWYNYVHDALNGWDQTETTEDGTIRLYNPQSKDPDRATETPQNTEQDTMDLPDWITKPAPQETTAKAPLTPSKIDTTSEEPAAISPLSSTQDNRFARGNLIHKILQFLPDLPPEIREKALQDYINRNGHNLTNSKKQEIGTEILRILNDPNYAMFFGEHSQAEVPITGLLDDGRIISGQIDRLLITNQCIWILDFKTNRPPPTDPKDVPKIYRDQMNAYRDTIRKIYPNREIKTALLWTYAPRLMIIEE